MTKQDKKELIFITKSGPISFYQNTFTNYLLHHILPFIKKFYHFLIMKYISFIVVGERL